MAINQDSKSYKDFLMQVSKLEPVEFLGLAKIFGVSCVEKELDVECGRSIDVKDEGTDNSSDKPGYKVRQAEDILGDMAEKYMSLERKGRRNVMRLLNTATKKKK